MPFRPEMKDIGEILVGCWWSGAGGQDAMRIRPQATQGRRNGRTFRETKVFFLNLSPPARFVS